MRNRGIGLAEILVSLLIISIAIVGFSRLMLANVKSSSYNNTQQLTNNAVQYIFDRINANLQTSNATSSSAQNYVETSYSSDTTTPNITCNSGNYCSQSQQALYDLYQWKQYLATLKIPQLNAIVCLDTSGNYGIPTLSSPNCSGSGDVVVKLVWQYAASSSESSLVSSTKYITVKVPTITTIDVHSIMGNSALANVIANALSLYINSSGNMYYVINTGTTSGGWYSCALPGPCSNTQSGTTTSPINQFSVYNNNIPLYSVTGNNTIYQCNDANCKSPKSVTTGNTSISAMYTVAKSNYAVTNKNVVYVDYQLNNNPVYASFVDYGSSSFQSGANLLPTATMSINSFLKIPVVSNSDILNTGVIYLGFSNGAVYLDTLGGTTSNNNYTTITHTITNTNATKLLQNVVDLTTYTNSAGTTYVVAANQNTMTASSAGLYYLDTTNISGGWSAICTGLTNGNVNSVSTNGNTAYFMVGGSDTTSSGMYSCDLSGIGK